LARALKAFDIFLVAGWNLFLAFIPLALGFFGYSTALRTNSRSFLWWIGFARFINLSA